jgi:hypothetical protein
LLEQVFNANEIVLLWKHRPICTSIAKDEKRPEASILEKARSKFCFVPVILETSLLIPG